MRTRCCLSGVVVVALLVFAMMNPVTQNLLSVVMEPGFLIPSESSLRKFRPTVWNEGSGEWWIYGEDVKAFYWFIGAREVDYLRIEKDKVASCPAFNPTNAATWRREFVTTGHCDRAVWYYRVRDFLR